MLLLGCQYTNNNKKRHTWMQFFLNNRVKVWKFKHQQAKYWFCISVFKSHLKQYSFKNDNSLQASLGYFLLFICIGLG